MTDFEPFALALRQVALDRDATARLPALFDRKRRRLAPSTHAFLRGSAQLFYELLTARRELASGPAGDGYLVGDMHLENVGAYLNDDNDVVFALNDFDDATIGPLRLDVLRLATSTIVASRELHATGRQAIDLAERAVSSYVGALGGGSAPATPAAINDLIARVGARTPKALLDDRAPMQEGRRRFLRGDRYRDLPPDVALRVPTLVRKYVEALGPRAPRHASRWEIEDSALRIAGNGSLGVLRVAVLVSKTEGEESLIELKECRTPSPAILFETPRGRFSHDGERWVNAAQGLCGSPPRLLAAVRLDDLSFVGRRLFPQEDKLDLASMHLGAKLDDLVGYVGHILGVSHARGASALGLPPPPPWTREDISQTVDHAVVIAGMLEGIYLAWARRDE